MSTPILVLITKAPTHTVASHALRYVRCALQAGHDIKLFFYAEGAVVANKLIWQTADQSNLTQEWQQLAQAYQLPLKVCVSTALARGISDAENAARHQLLTNDVPAENLAAGFELVGLTELMLMMTDSKMIQF